MKYRILKSEYQNLMDQCRIAAGNYLHQREGLLSKVNETSVCWKGVAADFLHMGLKVYLNEGEFEDVRHSYQDVADGMEALYKRVKDQIELQNEMALLISGENRPNTEELFLDSIMQEEMCNEIRSIMKGARSAVEEATDAVSIIDDLLQLYECRGNMYESLLEFESMSKQYIMKAEENRCAVCDIGIKLDELYTRNNRKIGAENKWLNKKSLLIFQPLIDDEENDEAEDDNTSETMCFTPDLGHISEEYELSDTDILMIEEDLNEIYDILGFRILDSPFTHDIRVISFIPGFGKYVPQNVSDITVLAVMSMYSAHGLDDDVIREHLENNENEWNDSLQKNRYLDQNGKYIEHQEEMTEIMYGVAYNNILLNEIIKPEKFKGDQNTCEVIAAYNALVALGASPSFPLMLAAFEQQGIVMSGYFGTSPGAINNYIKDEGYNTEMLIGEGISEDGIDYLTTEYSTYIMTAYNDKTNLYNQIHTVSITLEAEGYVIHNSSSSAGAYNTLQEAINSFNYGNGEAICVIGIRKREPLLWDRREMLSGDSIVC